MSRAEKQALKAYPRELDAWCESNVDKRIGYRQGYGQAEQDYKDILDLCNDVVSEYKNGSLGDGTIKELQRLMMTIRS